MGHIALVPKWTLGILSLLWGRWKSMQLLDYAFVSEVTCWFYLPKKEPGFVFYGHYNPTVALWTSQHHKTVHIYYLTVLKSEIQHRLKAPTGIMVSAGLLTPSGTPGGSSYLSHFLKQLSILTGGPFLHLPASFPRPCISLDPFDLPLQHTLGLPMPSGEFSPAQGS